MAVQPQKGSAIRLPAAWTASEIRTRKRTIASGWHDKSDFCAATQSRRAVCLGRGCFEDAISQDLEQALKGGALAPSTSGGIAVGIVQHGEKHVFAFGTAKTDSIFEIGSISKTFTGLILAQMVDVNGAKLAEEARRRRPDLKVLFTTGYTRNAIVHNGVLDAGVEMIGKPFTLEALATKLRAILEAPLR